MNQIEIARRCPACGVSIREQAFFCPQCGRQLSNVPALADTEPLHPPARSWADRTEHRESPTVKFDEQRSQNREQRTSQSHPVPSILKQTTATPNHNQTQPLEKLRHVSEEVLETASDDPTLRFLLVAALLVVISLFLLVLSKLIG